jgi:multicomponent Na+:H+ antiporter subunit E
LSTSFEAKQLNWVRRGVVFVILMAFWLLFSGKLDLFHLSLGVLCSALIAVVSGDLLIHDVRPNRRLKKSWRFLLYVPWLIYQVIMANFHVAMLVIDPKRIDPRIIRFRTKLKSDFAMVTYANSLTLTPGTITMDIDDGEFYVHALSKKVADDLEGGDMERRIAYIFMETEEGE